MLMPVISGLGWTFDTVASTYEKMRPGYSDELYDAIFDYIPIGEDSHALEVGIGGGQATLPVLKTGCRLTAVDPGEKFSALCCDKFRAFSKFSVITGKFEEVSLEENACDLVFSASAFHWVPEEEGYQKVFRVLKSGGAFARFANHPYRDKGKPALSDDIDALYARYYSTYHKKAHKPPVEYTEAEAVERADIAKKYGLRTCGMPCFTARAPLPRRNTYSCWVPTPITSPLRRRSAANSLPGSPKPSTTTVAR